MCGLFDDKPPRHPHLVNDPEADGNARGVRGAGFDTPTQENLEALFDVMHRFVCNYLHIYHPRNTAHRRGRRARRRRGAGVAHRAQRAVPNGVGVSPDDVTWDKLARLGRRASCTW